MKINDTYMKRIMFSLLFLLASGLSYANETPPLLTQHEAKEIDSIVNSLLVSGFHDSKEAIVYQGEVTVSASFDPTKGIPLPTHLSHMQHTLIDPNLITYEYKFNGLHFKLADGKWLFSVSYNCYDFIPGPYDKVDVTGATEINLLEFAEAAMKEFPFDAEKDAAKWLKDVDPAQKERSIAAMNNLVPLINKLKISPNSLAPNAVLLYRAGLREAGSFSLIIADQRSREYWQLRPWIDPSYIFDPTGKYHKSDEQEARWMKANPKFTPEPPHVALRRALFRWCRAQMWAGNPEDTMLPLEIAAETAKAMVDPSDPQGNTAKIDDLLAGMKLPLVPKENDLISRLQSWEIDKVRMPRIIVQDNNGTFSTSVKVIPPAYTPDNKDMDALVALLADERPSRFHDFNGPRTLGDSAWCALTELLGEDPRKLANYPVNNFWSDSERRSAAAAVQVWWKSHRTEYIAK